MKKQTNFLVISVIAALILSFTACGSGKTYSVTFNDADTFCTTSVPYSCVAGNDYAFNMMGITEVTINVTFKGGEYTFVSHDVANTDPNNGMYWTREITYTGTYTENKGTYALAAPAKVKEVLAYGTMFADYKDIWGEQGTFTEADETGKALLSAFVPCNATVSGDTITFDAPLIES